MKTVALVSCVKAKQSEPAQARDLYVSQLFRGLRRYAERTADRWWILSAQHGLLSPAQIISPYDQTLQRMTAAERAAWGRIVRLQLAQALPEPALVVILAGHAYRAHVIPWLLQHGHTVKTPLANLGIGQQLRWLKERTAE